MRKNTLNVMSHEKPLLDKTESCVVFTTVENAGHHTHDIHQDWHMIFHYVIVMLSYKNTGSREKA